MGWATAVTIRRRCGASGHHLKRLMFKTLDVDVAIGTPCSINHDKRRSFGLLERTIRPTALHLGFVYDALLPLLTNIIANTNTLTFLEEAVWSTVTRIAIGRVRRRRRR